MLRPLFVATVLAMLWSAFLLRYAIEYVVA